MGPHLCVLWMHLGGRLGSGAASVASACICRAHRFAATAQLMMT